MSKQTSHDSVRVHDSVESVCNGEHSRICESLPDRGLNESVRVHVHIRCRLVDHQNAGTTNQGSGEANQLSLADLKE